MSVSVVVTKRKKLISLKVNGVKFIGEEYHLLIAQKYSVYLDNKILFRYQHLRTGQKYDLCHNYSARESYARSQGRKVVCVNTKEVFDTIKYSVYLDNKILFRYQLHYIS